MTSSLHPEDSKNSQAADTKPDRLAGEGAADLSQSRWINEKAWEWYEQQPWMTGFNYVPAYACNTTEWWQEETFNSAAIDQELGWAKSTGFNATRAFIQYIVWKQNPRDFKQRFEMFLTLAAGHGIRVMPVLFDDCAFGDPLQLDPFPGTQREPIPGMILPSWTPSPGRKLGSDPAERPALKNYVQDMLRSFGQDKRILLWDLYNEPQNVAGAGQVPLLRDVFAWARDASTQQPLTIGVWNDRDTNEFILSQSDVISFHHYGNANTMLARINNYKKSGRPVICTEWMARPLGSSWQTDLPVFNNEGVGCFHWGLVNGRTQCQFPWDNKKGGPQPARWFHDLFHNDGTPYDAAEIEFISHFNKSQGKTAD